MSEEVEMNRRVVVAAMAAGLGALAAQAQEKPSDKLKIGVVATLSGPPAVLGQQLRNGFNLAVKTLGGKLGGRDVQVIPAGDELKPHPSGSKVKAPVQRRKVDFVVRPLFSQDLAPPMEPATETAPIPTRAN